MYYFKVPESVDNLCASIQEENFSKELFNLIDHEGSSEELNSAVFDPRGLQCSITFRTSASNMVLVNSKENLSCMKSPVCSSPEAPLNDYILTAAKDAIVGEFKSFDFSEVIPYTDIQVRGAFTSTIIQVDVIVRQDKCFLLSPVNGEWRPFKQVVSTKRYTPTLLNDAIIKGFTIVKGE